MASTFDELLEDISLEEWKDTIVETAESLGLDIENWSEGGFTRLMVALFGELVKPNGDVVKIQAASHVLEKAEGDWLALLAKNVFNVTKIEATYASAPDSITLTNTGGLLFAIDAGDLVVAHEDTKKTYRNTSGGTLNPLGELTLDLIAEETGSDSNAAIDKITELVTNFLGVTCTNPVALVGLDEEEDEALRERCRDAIAALSIGGVKKAYEFYAKSATREDGTSIGITRVKVGTPPGDGTVNVYIASSSGAIDPGDVDIVQALFDENVTPYGFNATAVSASNLSVSAPCTIWIPASLGMSEGDAQAAVDDALAAYTVAVAIGGVIISPATGKVYWRALLGIVEQSISGMLKAELDDETDLDVAVSEVPVWGGVTGEVTVNQVST